MNPICARIKELRSSLNLTQEQFAALLCIRRGAIANYEVGRNPPTASVKALLYKELHVSPDWLEHGIGSMFSAPASENIDLFLRNHGASDFELLLIKAIFSVDRSTRVSFLAQIQHFLMANGCLSSSNTVSTPGAEEA